MRSYHPDVSPEDITILKVSTSESLELPNLMANLNLLVLHLGEEGEGDAGQVGQVQGRHDQQAAPVEGHKVEVLHPPQQCPVVGRHDKCALCSII